MHRNERYWKEPLKFMPERFDLRVNPPITEFAYLPFSLGPRSCLGQKFAETEIIIILAAILQKYSIEPMPGDTLSTLKIHTVLTLQPKKHIKLQFKRRS